uniref:Uncharacterized protein n=1 Tax=Mycena chlorophos TaxID=658473 RepID=A0ABQ0LP64_MYCCL|nr:predicted protein [Mycena chlorophos]
MQIDIVLVSADDELKNALMALETTYVKAEVDLTRVVEQAEQIQVAGANTFTALSVNPNEEDIWCIDPRGVLTMHLQSTSYQVLGGGQSLVGKKIKVPRTLKGISEEYVVSLPLQPSFHKDRIREKRNAALAAWDARRRAGMGTWQVAYASSDHLETSRIASSLGHASSARQVKCSSSTLLNARVPNPTLELKPRPADRDGAEDWDDEMSDLFEWVGMAALGAQRIHANDHVDPFIAVYDPPECCRHTVGDITHLRWTGFLSPAFVQSVIDACRTSRTGSFVAVTCHGFATAPTAYIPLGKDGAPVEKASPPRIPDEDAEDSRCLLFANGRWCMAESVSGIDTRWG